MKQYTKTVALVITNSYHKSIATDSIIQFFWMSYVQHLQQYLATNKIEDADQQGLHVLLSVHSPATY